MRRGRLSSLGSIEAVRALMSWPTFSISSFRMVSALRRQGIVPATVIDAGANVGQFAVACAKLFPGTTVHSFEPLPECLTKLNERAAKLGNVTVYPMALGADAGEVSIHVNSYSPSSSILKLGARHRQSFPHTEEIENVTVKLSTLDLEMASKELPRPVLLKMDVQGYEPQVLEGAAATLSRVDYVLLEASFRPMYEGEKPFTEILRMLEERGFEFLRPIDWLEDPRSGEILQVDALFAKMQTAG